jgi:hypothetical protein
VHLSIAAQLVWNIVLPTFCDILRRFRNCYRSLTCMALCRDFDADGKYRHDDTSKKPFTIEEASHDVSLPIDFGPTNLVESPQLEVC